MFPFSIKKRFQEMARTSPAKFVRQVRGEITRITWATRKDTLTSTITVLIMVVIASLFFFAADSIISILIQWLFGIFSF